MSRLLTWVNALGALFLFFALTQIVSDWEVFTTSGSRLTAFIMGVVMIANSVYLAFGAEGYSNR